MNAFRFIFVIYLVSITYLSLAHIDKQVPVYIWDKGAHFSGYAVLFILLHLANISQQFWLKILYCFAYSWFIEVLQLITPYRQYEWSDLLANGIGVLIGFFMVWIFQKFVIKR